MRQTLRTFAAMLRCESGLNQIEYALLIGIVGVSLIVTLNLMGETVESTYISVNSDVRNAL